MVKTTHQLNYSKFKLSELVATGTNDLEHKVHSELESGKITSLHTLPGFWLVYEYWFGLFYA